MHAAFREALDSPRNAQSQGCECIPAAESQAKQTTVTDDRLELCSLQLRKKKKSQKTQGDITRAKKSVTAGLIHCVCAADCGPHLDQISVLKPKPESIKSNFLQLNIELGFMFHTHVILKMPNRKK